jgi:hypothetical protein
LQGYSQQHKIYGKVTNTKLEPLAFATLQLKNQVLTGTTREDGSYEIILENGDYDCIVSLIGYKKFAFQFTINKKDVLQNILLEEENIKPGPEVTIIGQKKDRAEEWIRNVIRNKEKTVGAVNSYSVSLYIRATEENQSSSKVKPKQKTDSANRDLQQMRMAEIQMKLDFQQPNKTKETREGVKKRGNPETLFYLSTTEGDFSLYNNLLHIRAVSETPFLSPVSYSGLIAYKYKTIRIRKQNNRLFYLIRFRPTKMGNALLTGELEIMDSAWVIVNASFSLPKFHLVEYDHFIAEQVYQPVRDSFWLLARQQFSYEAKLGKNTKSGTTLVTYTGYEINPVFPKKHFGTEKSSTTAAAYERDSVFWNNVRTEPLTEKEIRFIRYKDSVFRATNTKAYLDSMDAITNKITAKKVLFDGLTFYDRKKERTVYIGSLTNLYEPFSPGGARIGYNFHLTKFYKNKKNISLSTMFSFGLRNKDLNGNMHFGKLYNPFNSGYYSIDFGRSFDQLFEGDVLFNSFQKRNLYRKYNLFLGHNVELLNGLFLNNQFEIAYRQSIAGFQFWNKWSEIIQDSATLALNTPQDFKSHGALYNNITLSYTPFQDFMREPYQKVLLGSKWPTFSLKWRKGIPNIIGSTVDYDYVEFNIRQKLQLGTVGISEYSFITGKFLNQRKLELPDKKYIRGRDPYLFLFPQSNFQHMDSTFTLSRDFYEAHYLHNFNGAIFNKIPFLKKLKLKEVAGGGFLIAGERNLRYFEAFAGIESMPFRIWTEKFKLGIFAVGSVANQFKNPVQIKFSIRQWDKYRNRWL